MSKPQGRVLCDDLTAACPLLATDDVRRLRLVLRLGPGSALELFDGRGGARSARIVDFAGDTVRLVWTGPRVESVRTRVVWMAAAIPKGKRADFMVEKVCELGVTRLTPLVTERGVVRPEADGSKARRWEAIAEEASRQCRRDDVLEIDPPQPLEEWIRGLTPGSARFFAHPSDDAVPGRILSDVARGTSLDLAVGPEGGWTEAEREHLVRGGFRAVRLGPRILRVETAAIALAVWAGAGGGDSAEAKCDRPNP